MTVNFLLPMKAHSERVPDKNMKFFRGNPLYHFVLRELYKSLYLGKIFVDTDSDPISEDLVRFFPEVVILKRPNVLCGDDVSMNKIIQHDLAVIDGDYFFQTHSTNPLLRVETIDKAINFFFVNVERYDSVFSVSKIQSRLYWANGGPINHNPEELIRTQDLSAVYEENSNFYIFSRQSFVNSGNKRIGRNPYLFEIPRIEAQDIDTQEDFELALLIYDYIKRQGK